QRERGWVRVCSRREKREQHRATRREDTHQTPSGIRNGHGQRYSQDSWRGRTDIVSFYFTRFLEKATEKDLWKHFKKFGDVREVFIPKNRNKTGRRYGFVRFKGVEDVHSLERKLDNVVYGGLRMYVNTPKFARTQQSKSELKQFTPVEHRGVEVRWPRQMQPRPNQGSYADVVTGNQRGTRNKRIVVTENSSNEGSWSSVYLEVPETGINWLKEAWVGRLKNLVMFDRLEDDVYWGDNEDLALKYLGDDMVLILGLTDERAEKMMAEENEGRVTPFHSLEKWSPKLRTGYRLTWVSCWGIPLQAWDSMQISKIMAFIGDIVDMEDDVDAAWRLDKVRVLLKTPRRPLIRHTAEVHIKGEVYRVYIVEE
ncbi:hypothetical protein glysoja_048782, partial [Glycine soja]